MYGVISGGGVIGSRIAKGTGLEVKVDQNFLYLKVDGLDFKPSIVIIEMKNPVNSSTSRYYLTTFDDDKIFNLWASHDGGNMNPRVSPQSKDQLHKDLKIYEGFIYMENGKFSVVTARASIFDSTATWAVVREPQTVKYIAIE